MNYWQEALEYALDAAGCFGKLTDVEIQEVSESLAHSADLEGEATGRLCIPNPLESELKATKQALRDEKEKIVCKECDGRGRIITPGPYHYGDSECWKCHGEGRHKP